MLADKVTEQRKMIFMASVNATNTTHVGIAQQIVRLIKRKGEENENGLLEMSTAYLGHLDYGTTEDKAQQATMYGEALTYLVAQGKVEEGHRKLRLL
jgi:hypothetical protein